MKLPEDARREKDRPVRSCGLFQLYLQDHSIQQALQVAEFAVHGIQAAKLSFSTLASIRIISI
jgi:hypothetical protein